LRKLLIVSVLALVAIPAFCKDKKKQRLPDVVLNASTIAVFTTPGAGESITGDQQKARAAVEHALREWGRFRVETLGVEAPQLDLIIEVHKGGGARPTIAGIPDRGSTIDRTSAGVDVAIGGRGGNRERPQVQTESASPEDDFCVYLPSEGSKTLVFRYSANHALDAPTVRAVEEFKRAIQESENAKKQSNP